MKYYLYRIKKEKNKEKKDSSYKDQNINENLLDNNNKNSQNNLNEYKNEYKNNQNIEIIPCLLNNIKLSDKDKVIITESESMIVLGAYYYDKQKNSFILEKKILKNLRSYYTKLPMIKYINERTYKLFAKRIRNITKEDYDVFLSEK